MHRLRILENNMPDNTEQLKRKERTHDKLINFVHRMHFIHFTAASHESRGSSSHSRRQSSLEIDRPFSVYQRKNKIKWNSLLAAVTATAALQKHWVSVRGLTYWTIGCCIYGSLARQFANEIKHLIGFIDCANCGWYAESKACNAQRATGATRNAFFFPRIYIFKIEWTLIVYDANRAPSTSGINGQCIATNLCRLIDFRTAAAAAAAHMSVLMFECLMRMGDRWKTSNVVWGFAYCVCAILMLAEHLSIHDDDQTDKLNEAKQFIQSKDKHNHPFKWVSHGRVRVFVHDVLLSVYRESVAASLDTQNDM